MNCLTHGGIFEGDEDFFVDIQHGKAECPRAFAYKLGIPARWIEGSGPCRFESEERPLKPCECVPPGSGGEEFCTGACFANTRIMKIVCPWTLSHTAEKYISGNYFSPNVSHGICAPCYHIEMQRLRDHGSPLQKAMERRFN